MRNGKHLPLIDSYPHQTMGSDHITLSSSKPSTTPSCSFLHTTYNIFFFFSSSWFVPRFLASFLHTHPHVLVVLLTPTCPLFLPLGFVSEEIRLLEVLLHAYYLTFLILMHIYCLLSSSFYITGYIYIYIYMQTYTICKKNKKNKIIVRIITHSANIT